jgi:hypothetical protein
VRRRILELLASGESSSGAIVTVIQGEFGITQAAVLQHLKVLRDSGFASVRAEVRAASTRSSPHPCSRSTPGSTGSATFGRIASKRWRPRSRAASANAVAEKRVTRSLLGDNFFLGC